jgi:hypothetical protein
MFCTRWKRSGRIKLRGTQRVVEEGDEGQQEPTVGCFPEISLRVELARFGRSLVKESLTSRESNGILQNLKKPRLEQQPKLRLLDYHELRLSPRFSTGL